MFLWPLQIPPLISPVTFTHSSLHPVNLRVPPDRAGRHSTPPQNRPAATSFIFAQNPFFSLLNVYLIKSSYSYVPVLPDAPKWIGNHVWTVVEVLTRRDTSITFYTFWLGDQEGEPKAHIRKAYYTCLPTHFPFSVICDSDFVLVLPCFLLNFVVVVFYIFYCVLLCRLPKGHPSAKVARIVKGKEAREYI